MDIKLYHTTGDYPYAYKDIETLTPSVLSMPGAYSRVEVLANKVLKFFLTDKGSDLFDREYGSLIFQTNQISPQYLPLFKLEVKNDVDRCVQYFRRLNKLKEGISTIIVRDITLTEKKEHTSTGKELDTPWVTIVLEVVTTKNNRASIQVCRT